MLIKQADRKLSDIVLAPSPPPDWLVPDLLHRGQMIILAGEAGIGKSTLVYTLAVAKATGGSFLGRPLDAGKVLYFDEENSQADFEEYLRWVWRGLGEPKPTLLDDHLQFERFQLAAHAPKHFEYMLEAARTWQPELIVLDTATPACQIFDENDNGEATRAISHLRGIQQAVDPSMTFLIVKHAKLDHEDGHRRIRGAKTWVGSTDATLFHLASPGRKRNDGLRASCLEPEKVRAFGLRHPLRIIPSWTGTDEQKGLTLKGIGDNMAYGGAENDQNLAAAQLIDSINPT